MTALTTRDALAKIERLLAHYETSPIGNRCLTCGHVKHNELGYCQNGTCVCGDGTTVAGLAGIIRRDLRESVIDAATLADDEALVDGARAGIAARLTWASMHWGTEDVHPDAWPHIAKAAAAGVAAALTERGAQ